MGGPGSGPRPGGGRKGPGVASKKRTNIEIRKVKRGRSIRNLIGGIRRSGSGITLRISKKYHKRK